MKTKCNHCGIETNRQPAGDGCHSCNRGTMEPTDIRPLIQDFIVELESLTMFARQSGDGSKS